MIDKKSRVLNNGLFYNSNISFLKNRSKLFLGGLVLFFTLLPLKLISQNIAKKEVQAYRLENSDEFIFDGRVAEEFWGRVPAATNFLQQEPNEGAQATEKTEVRIAYDDEYLYICLLYTSPSPRDQRGSRMPSSA